MGNRLTCCRQTWVEFHDVDEKFHPNNASPQIFSYRNVGADFSEETSHCVNVKQLSLLDVSRPAHIDPHFTQPNSTQHISEREPEDYEFDPSLNASQHTLFLSGLHNERKGLQNYSVKSCSNYQDELPIKRWSSCSTVYIGDSWLFRPDLQGTISSVSIALELLIRSEVNKCLSTQLGFSEQNDLANSLSVSELCNSQNIYYDVYQIFDERRNPIEVSCRSGGSNLDVNTVYFPHVRFIRSFLGDLFSTALLGPECAIVSLIFLERLVNAAEVAVTSWSWRRQILACVLLASKVLDDQAVWNIDYCQILRDVKVEDLNALERHTLKLLQFNINVPFAVYARYYFDLLTVIEQSDMMNFVLNRQLLTADRVHHFRTSVKTNDFYPIDNRIDNMRFLFELPYLSDPNVNVDTKSNRTVKQNNKSNKNTEILKHKKFVKTPYVSRTNHKITTMTNSKFLNTTVTATNSNVCTIIKPEQNETNEYYHIKCTEQYDNISMHSNGHSESVDPIELDEETEFINSMTNYPLSGENKFTNFDDNDDDPYKNNQLDQKSSLKSQLPLFSLFKQRNSIPYTPLQNDSSVIISDVINHSNSNHLNSSILPNDAYNSTIPSSSSNGTEFVRSLMGGEVAYSLLRDAGMY